MRKGWQRIGITFSVLYEVIALSIAYSVNSNDFIDNVIIISFGPAFIFGTGLTIGWIYRGFTGDK
jgi:hypothetical protein